MTDQELREAREYAIHAAIRRYVDDGKTPGEARAIVEVALAAPWPSAWPRLPPVDE